MQILGFISLPGHAEMLVLLLLGVLILPAIFYLLTLQTAFSRCSPESRTLSPGLVWLGLIPLFNLFWNFVLVISVSKSLGNEFRRRGVVEEPSPGLSLGLAMAICSVLSLTPFLGLPISIAGFVCWIIYWVRIAGYSSRIAAGPIGQSEGA